MVRPSLDFLTLNTSDVLYCMFQVWMFDMIKVVGVDGWLWLVGGGLSFFVAPAS